MNFLIAFVAGLIGGGAGMGSSILMVPLMAILWPSRHPQELTAIALLVVAINSFLSTLTHSFSSQMQWRNGFYVAILALPGVMLGAVAVKWLPISWLMFAYGILMLLLVAVKLVDEAKSPVSSGEQDSSEVSNTSTSTTTWMMAAGSTLAGIVSTVLGFASGDFFALVLRKTLGQSQQRAVITSYLTIFVMIWPAIFIHYLFRSYSGSLIRDALLIIFGIVVGGQVGTFAWPHLKGRLMSIVMVCLVGFCAIYLLAWNWI